MLLVSHFAEAFAERTGNPPDLNPYLRRDFRSLDVWQMLIESESPEPEPQSPKRRRRKKVEVR